MVLQYIGLGLSYRLCFMKIGSIGFRYKSGGALEVEVGGGGKVALQYIWLGLS